MQGTTDYRDEAAAGHGTLVHTMAELRGELVSFLSRRLLCRATAEDIVQDVFIRLAASPVAARHPRALIFKTAANLASNHRRDERRRADLRQEWLAPADCAIEECDPERTAVARDTLRRLAETLARWPARTREVFILNRYDGLNQREIAEQLRISSTSVERHMARAVRNIAALLAQEGW